MGYKSDHEFRTDLWRKATKGLPSELDDKAHRHLGKYYGNKNEMSYRELLDAVKEFMSDYEEWSWNGDRWIEGKRS